MELDVEEPGQTAHAALRVAHQVVEGHQQRESIARRARALAQERLGRAPSPDRVYVIGDTPSDVAAGRAIGARTVAVATGGYELAELEDLEPWWAVGELPAPEEFAERLGLVSEG